VDVLVIDIGGSHVKLFESIDGRSSQFDSDRALTPESPVERVVEHTNGWLYEVVSIGFPGAAGPSGPRRNPPKLGSGWVGFDFAAAFKRPVRVVNDAALQALGAYRGGRMLFLGLGTGLGSAMVGERVIMPLELGSLQYNDDETLAARLGKAGLERHGRDKWQHSVERVVERLREAFDADYITLGGGNVTQVDPLPPDVRRGGNEDASAGGVRLWEDWVEAHDVPRSHIWRVVW